jgi:hypothetical protein
MENEKASRPRPGEEAETTVPGILLPRPRDPGKPPLPTNGDQPPAATRWDVLRGILALRLPAAHGPGGDGRGASIRRTEPGARKLILLVLWAHADAVGRCYPSLRTIAAEAGLAVATVKRALAALERDGLLIRLRRLSGPGTLSSTAYTINADAILADGGGRLPGSQG